MRPSTSAPVTVEARTSSARTSATTRAASDSRAGRMFCIIMPTVTDCHAAYQRGSPPSLRRTSDCVWKARSSSVVTLSAVNASSHSGCALPSAARNSPRCMRGSMCTPPRSCTCQKAKRKPAALTTTPSALTAKMRSLMRVLSSGDADHPARRCAAALRASRR